MKTKNPYVPQDGTFEILGYIEEFDDANTFKPLGFRRIDEPTRPTGSPGRTSYTLPEAINLLKGYKQTPVVIGAGRTVIATIQIVCGRTIEKSKPCDWEIRKANGDKFDFVPCGQPGNICTEGPAWQVGHIRCSQHRK